MNTSSAPVGALKDIKVVDLSRILAGPWASQSLADMGAQVFKIERLKTGDDTRHWGPPYVGSDDGSQQAAYFHSANRNKQSLAIDFTGEKGQQLIKELVRVSDVFIENFTVGTLSKYGLDFDSLKAINPKLVYCSITGFGQTGPHAHRAGYDAMIQGEGGLMSITGETNGSPVKVGVAVVDVMTGLYTCNAILAALMARHHTQCGQYIDIALLDVQLATLANQGMNYLATGQSPKRQGNAHPNIVPYQTFATSDGNVIVAVGNDQQFERFSLLCEQSTWAEDERYQTNANRVRNRDILLPEIARIVATKPTLWWIKALENVAIPCGAVNTIAQAFDHPQIKHRGMVKTIPNEVGTLIETVASPINLSDTPLQYKSAAPNLGQHTRQILSDILHYDDDAIEALYDGKVIG